MLEFVRRRTSERKRLLFACGCFRSIWGLTDPSSREAVETCEAYADGKVHLGEVEQVARRVPQAAGDQAGKASAAVAHMAWAVSNSSILSYIVGGGAFARAEEALEEAVVVARRAWSAASVAHCGLVREVFNNPFRPITLDPTWRTPTVVQLAQSLYDERCFEDMPVLADALEEAGCTNGEVLDHCRSPGPHVRGCWVVDLVLDKG
jgi:hypothetical protein